ncbi:MAG TPA: site-2 protease family protein [Terriglobales bacterium]|nr:site-2 protease family protein [Terriglobales bacterium]
MGTWISAIMRSWSFPVGHVGKVHLRVHLSFLFLLVFIWMTEAAALGSAGLGRGLALAAIVLGSVIVHELAHSLLGIRRNLPPRVLILLPIGGITLVDDADQRQDPGGDVSIALAGPVANLLLAFVGASIVLALMPESRLWTPPLVYAGNLLRSFVWVNVFLCAFNLLPAYPLDGGRILRARLARHSNLVQATRRAVSVGQLFAMLFIFAGIWNTWLMMAGFFLFLAAQLEERTILFQSVMDNLRLEDVMLTDFSTLSPADTLEDALAKAVHTLQDDFPVIRGSDMVGVVSRQKIVTELRSQGNGYVQTVMNKVFEAAQRRESLASGLRKLSRRGLSLIPVVDEGRLVGIVTFQNLMHSIRLLAESKKLKRDEPPESQ